MFEITNFQVARPTRDTTGDLLAYPLAHIRYIRPTVAYGQSKKLHEMSLERWNSDIDCFPGV